jgi:protein O-GlcNAc transferase
MRASPPFLLLMGSELNATALFAEAMRLAKLGQLAAAESRLRQCLDAMPGSTMLLGNLAALLVMQGKYPEARISIEQVLAIDPNIAEAWLNLGIIEEEQHADFEAALGNFEAALKLRANYPEAHYNRANMLAKMYRLEDAIASYRQALKLAPGYVDALHNLANTLRSAKQPALALEAFNAAIKLNPSADLYANRGYALRDVGQYQAAIKSFDKALQLDPAAASCHGIRLHSKAQICDWSNWQGQLEEMIDSIDRREPAATPLSVLQLVDSGPLQRQAAELWTTLNYPAQQQAQATLSVTPQSNSKLRVGYFSADFSDHPVAKFLVNLLEHHDKSHFESIGFSLARAPGDAMQQRISSAFDQFHDVSQKSDHDIASLARRLGVDIAIDLGGHTAQGRPGIFALRAAPIQVNYLGYPGTMGASYTDYLMADAVVIPRQNANWYCERIVALPNLYTNAYLAEDVSVTAQRSDYQLPVSSVVYCCLSNTWKLDPVMFASWMQILKSTGDSVLLLLGTDPLVITNLRSEAKKSGVDPKRLVFSGRVAKSEYLARFRLADVFLDTYPYNAATTALDALFMGLPLVTLCGATYASRQAASVLATLGMGELVTTSHADYQALAIALGQDPQRLSALKVRLAAAAASSPAFDAKRYTTHVEAAFSAMQTLRRQGLSPDHIDIDATTRA